MKEPERYERREELIAIAAFGIVFSSTILPALGVPGLLHQADEERGQSIHCLPQ